MTLRTLFAFSALALTALAVPATAQAPLTPRAPIVVPGGPGAFDWMAVDAPMGRLFASHKGTKSTTLLDLKTHKVSSLPTGAAQGIAVDTVNNKIFFGDEEEKQIVIFSRKTLKKLASIPVTGPVDAVAVDTKRGVAYGGHDDGTEVWVVDGKTNKLTGSVKITGAPEFIEYDPKTDRLYQNVKTTNMTEVINPETQKSEAQWPSAPLESPHGLALDSETGRVFVAGNGKCNLSDIATGKVLSTVDIAPGYVDQIVFDPALKRVYCASRGFLTVVQETPDGSGITALAQVPQPAGAHTVTVDPKTSDVWICYADKKNSYLMPFTANK